MWTSLVANFWFPGRAPHLAGFQWLPSYQDTGINLQSTKYQVSNWVLSNIIIPYCYFKCWRYTCMVNTDIYFIFFLVSLLILLCVKPGSEMKCKVCDGKTDSGPIIWSSNIVNQRMNWKYFSIFVKDCIVTVYELKFSRLLLGEIIHQGMKVWKLKWWPQVNLYPNRWTDDQSDI